MRKNTAEQEEVNELVEELQIPVFGYELIRDILLNDILGKDSPQVLYWGGKQLARKFPLASIDEVISFFHNASWGNLEIIKQTKDEMELVLTGDLVERRFNLDSNCHFRLESGFIAEQLQLQKKFITETAEETKYRARKVIFMVKWDLKDSIE